MIIAIVEGIYCPADTGNSLSNQPQGPELNALAKGFRQLEFRDDMELNRKEMDCL